MRALSVAALLALAGMLGACSDGGSVSGGVGGGGGSGGGGGGSSGSDLPASALQSSDGLIAYMKQLIATQTNETSEPIRLGDVTLPVSDNTEPANVN